MYRDLFLERLTERKLNPAKMTARLKAIAQVASRNSTYGVVGSLDTTNPKPEIVGENYRYCVKLRISKTSYRSEAAANERLDRVEVNIRRAAERRGWVLQNSKNEPNVFQNKPEPEKVIAAKPDFKIGNLDQSVLDNHFKGVFSRESHIRIIHSATEMAVSTGFRKRRHVLLYGKAASCKTTVFNRLKNWYEGDGTSNRVKIIDATTATKAGLETWILSNAQDGTLPEILCLEEIEKFEPNNLLCLLGVMDHRCVISRTNARIGTSSAIARLLIWATCNNARKLKEFQSGALWSRFSHQLPCTRPSRDEMLAILLNEIAEIGGNPAWAEPALNFGWDVLRTDDPRKITSLLDGRERLLDESYQIDYLTVLSAAEDKKRERRKPNFNKGAC
jgi:hypothetical protein